MRRPLTALMPPGIRFTDEGGRHQSQEVVIVARELRPSDKVEWDMSQGVTHGHVVRKQTSKTRIKGHTVKASKKHPQYIVESDKSGKRAATPEEGLRRRYIDVRASGHEE